MLNSVKYFITSCLFIFNILNCGNTESKDIHPVQVGAEVMITGHLQELEGKRVGLIMHPASRIGDTHMLDTLLSLGVEVTALYAPEHGFRGDYGAGEIIEGGVDAESGLPVYSLYGSQKAPDSEMLAEVDVLIFDLQDVGARFFTYISTMKYSMEAAAQNEVEFWILDRPNPAGGEYVSGWILEKEYESFVGLYPIPVAHGMTVGELASMAVGEGWISGPAPELKVIPMKGWSRSMAWPETGLQWIPPSPNLPAFENAYLYLGTCLIEGTPLSEGRGTSDPFLLLGHPDMQPGQIDLEYFRSEYGTEIDTVQFVPQSIPGKSRYPKNEGEINYGVRIQAYQKSGELIEDPVRFGTELMKALMEATSGADYNEFLFSLSGSQQVLSEEPLNWSEAVENFRKQRAPYLLYR